jgi:ribosomal-protein-alanine N-acetyltransferase
MTGSTIRPVSRQRATHAGVAGKRVLLRPLVRADSTAFVAAAQASRALHGAWVSPPATADAFAARWKRLRDDPRTISFVAARRSDGALVGVLNLSEIIRGPLQQAYLGYYAFAPHAGQGYMREAMDLLLRYAFSTLKLHRIEANIQPHNAPSIALAQGAGFVKEGFSERYLKIAGRWRDHERWAINAEVWRRQRAARRGES